MIKKIKIYLLIIARKVVSIPFIFKSIDRLHKLKFPGSQQYWEHNYAKGGNSGAGSYNRLALFKAEVINTFVKDMNIKSVIEFGCGDANQLKLSKYPNFIGFDVSPTAIKICKDTFAQDKTKSFFLYDSLCFVDNHNLFKADLTLSLDVIYHLIEDEVYYEYMRTLFNISERFVIIYSSNFDNNQRHHEKDRQFTKWINANAPNWTLNKIIKNEYPYKKDDPINTSKADFYIFEKQS